MTRCDYDAVFYRVFCVTLLAIAFTFTIILTNVFVDIDGLLSGKQGKHKNNVAPKAVIFQDDFTREPTLNDENSFEDNEGPYRTKRSIETQNVLFHIKNSNLKNILTTRLESLLEALDAEESSQKVKTVKTTPKNDINEIVKAEKDDKIKEETTEQQKDDDMMHLTMHNILLQGIIGHMNLKEVYKRMNSLTKNSETETKQDVTDNQNTEENQTVTKTESEEDKKKASIENNFLAEIVKCNKVQNDILSTAVKKILKQAGLGVQKTSPDSEGSGRPDLDKLIRSLPQKTAQQFIPPSQDVPVKTNLGPNISIKTTIDIQSKSTGNESDDTSAKGNIHGIIELIYNGKSIKFTRPDVDNKQSTQKKPLLNIIQPKYTKINKLATEMTSQANVNEVRDNIKKVPKDFVSKFIAEYFKHFPRQTRDFTKEINEKIITKRLKRHVKIKIKNEENNLIKKQQDKPDKKKNTKDEELYVEIDFAGKGIKGEEKHKLMKSIMDKIQKVISEDVKNGDKNKKHKSLHVKKRIQNPLEHKDRELMNKYTYPSDSVLHRQLNPIIGPRINLNGDNYPPNMRDKSGDAWKKEFIGPTFLTRTKSINSAEMSEVEVDYNKVLNVNGIPQRLQKPLNNDMSDEIVKTNPYLDLGNMKFFIKDFDGTGFSIGFNQYFDEPPDPETVKLFTGLKDVLNTYQNIDQTPDLPLDDKVDHLNYVDKQETIPIKNGHIIVRRSVNEKHDYHSNEYKIIYDGGYLPYNDYKEIFESSKSKKSTEFNNNYQPPLIVDENIFDKNLKPSEIFGLANLFRKKRSLKVRKISSLKSKMRINRYLNTNAVTKKRIFLNQKRNKREISKIRIVASDFPYKQTSDENIFVVSDENVFADRAIIKDVEKSEPEPEKIEEPEYVPLDTENKPYDLLYSKARHNNLMSKYPHAFMEEITRSKEDLVPDYTLVLGKIPLFRRFGSHLDNIEKVYDTILHENTTGSYPFTLVYTESPTTAEPKVQDLVDALQVQPPKANYKITVKVTPKNGTYMNTGFKEIHTSINKRYNKDGLIYSSLVNVSEISKVTNLNKTKDPSYYNEAAIAIRMKDQNGKMQNILRQHQKNINEQLQKLYEEKHDLESLLVDQNNTNVTDLHLNAGELRSKTTPTTTTTTASTTTSTTTTSTTQPTTTTEIFTETSQRNILHTIEKNENLTTLILKKIDRNTEIIQRFLKKLSDKIVSPIPAKDHERKAEDPIIKYNNNPPFSIEWKHPPLPFNPAIIRRNESHVAIPFVYTYQHPVNYVARSDNPIASMVYHGHIHGHTNNMPSKEVVQNSRDTKLSDIEVQTKFFIDDSLDNGYKVLPVNEVAKLTGIKNMTNIL